MDFDCGDSRFYKNDENENLICEILYSIEDSGMISIDSSMPSVAATLTRLTGTMTAAYWLKPILKKSADTMLTRLDTISGRLAVSAINPAAITNASVACLLNPSASRAKGDGRARLSALVAKLTNP